jgi:hypothetical protein
MKQDFFIATCLVKSFLLKVEQCPGGKRSKKGSQGWLKAMLMGQKKLFMFVRGTGLNLYCCKNVKMLPVENTASRKACLDI